MDSQPETERDPLKEQRHVAEITDPYRWLEGGDEAVTDWEQRQNKVTDDVVETERRESLAPAFEELGYHATYFLPTVRGGRYLKRIETAEVEQPSLTVRDSLADDPETLVDPATLDETTALQWFVPDRSGDTRVHPAYAHKMTARVQTATTQSATGASKRPVTVSGHRQHSRSNRRWTSTVFDLAKQPQKRF
jgi:prolyl oligopeptidase